MHRRSDAFVLRSGKAPAVLLMTGACATLGASVITILWILGGITAVTYLAILLLVTFPGLPLGVRLFGRHHPAGWIFGMLLGYATTALACWAVVFAGRASNLAFVGGWAIVTSASWILLPLRADGGEPLVSLARWTGRNTAALALVLLLVPVLMGPALSRIDAQDASGNRLYRAYFTADFVWHRALVAELTKHAQPPRDPFLASQPIHYYWTYFLVPATVGPLVGADTELSLEVNALATGLLFLSTLYLVAWSALPAYPFAVAAALFLTVVATSAEGLAAIVYVLRDGHSLDALRDLNVDAMSRGFGGLRIDDLPRALWYTPHHSMAGALGLLSLPVAITAGVRARPLAVFLTGIALAASVTFNPLVGGICCAVYGVTVLIDAIRIRATVKDVLRHAIAIIPVLLALEWISLNQIASGTEAAFQFWRLGPDLRQPVPSFLLSFGPLLVLLGAGLWPQREIPIRTVAPACIGVLLSVLVMHLVVMKVDVFWVGFRTGHLIFAFAPMLVARGLIALSRTNRVVAAAVVTLVMLVGAPTTIIDAFNAQDVNNARMGPGFHWTIRITPAEQEALAWIRKETPADAIVQAEPMARGRETWSLIPTWAERRMAGGEPISLMHKPEYDAVSAQVEQIYASSDPSAAWRSAKQLHIAFLYVDDTERSAYPNVTKFDADAEHFLPVFRNSEVVVYAVQ